ncbi:hypothetical protein AB0M29_44145 [Streptomyces sp. NPDC051976]|uniref:hypothetical protein n=1 Tax=Streptomyces sp. NPDC051976 TaxID=3154947 RepID=UPI00341E0F9D
MGLDGNWHLFIDSPMGKRRVSLGLVETDGTLAGALVPPGGNTTTEIFAGTINGNVLRFQSRPRHLKVTVTFYLTAYGNELSGTVTAGMLGSFRVSGQRCWRHRPPQARRSAVRKFCQGWCETLSTFAVAWSVFGYMLPPQGRTGDTLQDGSELLSSTVADCWNSGPPLTRSEAKRWLELTDRLRADPDEPGE